MAVVVALFLPFITNWINNNKPSKLVPLGKSIISQNSRPHGRLIIKNEGDYIAKSVEAYLVKITFEGKPRENFFPVPLSWTHNFKNCRDIYHNQSVYLDLFRKSEKGSDYCFSVTAGMEIDNLDKMDQGESELLIKLYQESGQVVSIQVEISWSDDDEYPKILSFKLI